MVKASARETPNAPERHLLGLLLRGQTPAQAADALGLDPAQAREMLAALARRSGVPGPRQLLVRALVHGWPLR